MRIREVISQTRRDFTALFECETCGETETKQGYDDLNYHNNVIPDMRCGSCNCRAPSDYRPLQPKHPEEVTL